MTQGGSPPDLKRVKELFDRALEMEASEWAALLDQECGSDSALRAEVEALLATLSKSEGFLEAASRTEPEQRQPLESGSSVGPYRLVEPLGRGGCGLVYRARHGGTGEEVALKTVQSTREALVASIRREIRALARIRHPGIVRIVDDGVVGGLPWYAMELLPGVTLRHYVGDRPEGKETEPRGWWTRTTWDGGRDPASGAARVETRSGPKCWEVDLPQKLTLVRRLCAPLAFLHGEGIVHRDLKPDNILVRPNGMPVIVDFGLVEQPGGPLSREVLELRGDVSGTLQYMAPEQMEGKLLDARADLYSLGCILYEMLTGKPPLEADSPSELRRMFATFRPEPPSRLAADLPPGLDELVLKLLAPEPRDRIGHADDVAAALAAMGAENGHASVGPSPRPYLYRAELAGRRGILDQLLGYVQRARRGEGNLLLLAGESGVGKTRLVNELATAARRRGVAVLTGECLPSMAPLQALRKPLQAIADRCRSEGPETSDRLLGPRARILSKYEESLSHLPGKQAYPEPAALPADAARIRVCGAIMRSLEALASEAPVLLVLDDLQWADDLTCDFLLHYLRAEGRRRRRILILGTHRSEEANPALNELLDAPGTLRLEVDRLEEGAVASMVGDMLAAVSAPEALAAFLARHSEGNPFFVAEYLRTAIAERLLRRDHEGRWRVVETEEGALDQLPLPGSIQELVFRRLETLPPRARGVAEIASVIGREMSGRVLDTACGLDETEAMDAVAELLVGQVLEEREPGTLHFVHDKIREVAYAAIAPDRIPSRHRAAAEAIESCHPERRGAYLADLGLHWEKAGEPDKAKPCLLAAARQATSKHSLQEAERLYRAYLALVESPTVESISARNELGSDVLQPRGRMKEAEALHETSLQEATALDDRPGQCASLHQLGSVRFVTGAVDEARQAHEESRTLARGMTDLGSEARALRSLAKLHQSQGRMEMARELFEQALAKFRSMRDRRGEGSVLGDLGGVHLDLGRPEEARELFEQSLRRARERKDRRDEGVALSSLAILDYQQGRMEEAYQAFEQALVTYREVGNRGLEGTALGRLALIHHEQGRVDEARELYEQALEIHREVGDRGNEGRELGNLANLNLEGGRLEEAREILERSLQIARELGNRRQEGLILGNLAGLHKDQGRIADGEGAYRLAIAIAREVADRRVEAIWLGGLAALLKGEGQAEEARSMFEQSIDILREVKDRHFEGHMLGNLATLHQDEGRLKESRLLVEQALATYREIGFRQGIAGLTANLSSLELFEKGDLDRAEDHLAEAVRIYMELGDDYELAGALCSQGHLQLARGEDARDVLERVRALVSELGVGSQSQRGIQFGKLERAQARHEEGGSLVCGRCLEDLGPELMGWLRANRPEILP